MIQFNSFVSIFYQIHNSGKVLTQKGTIRVNLFILFLLWFHPVVKAQVQHWTTTTGNTTVYNNDYAIGTAIDNNGDIIVSGNFTGNINLDPTGALSGAIISSTTQDYFIAKYNSSGNVLWVKKSSGTSYETIYAMTLDASGNIYITGTFASTMDFDLGSGIASAFSPGSSSNIFLVKYDNNGNYLWMKNIGSSGNTDNGLCIAVDNNSNVIIGGHFTGSVFFDPTNSLGYKVSAGGMDAFVAKYDSNGVYQWVSAFGVAAHWERCLNLCTDNNNNIYASGSFEGILDSDPGPLVNNITSLGNTDIFVSKFNPNGGLVWGKSLGTTQTDLNDILKCDVSGNLYLGGTYYDTIDIDLGSGVMNLTSNHQPAFIVKYNTAGQYLNHFTLVDSSYGGLSDLLFDAASNLIIIGGFNSYGQVLDFDKGPGTFNMMNNSVWQSAFAVRYNSSLNFMNAFQLEATYASHIYKAAINGNVLYVAGSFRDTIDCDPLTNVDQRIGDSSAYDILIGKYSFGMTTSSNEISRSEPKINLYPNPTDHILYISIPVTEASPNQIHVIDIFGRILIKLNEKDLGGQHNINLQVKDLKQGNYLLEFMYSNGVQQVMRFVKE